MLPLDDHWRSSRLLAGVVVTSLVQVGSQFSQSESLAAALLHCSRCLNNQGFDQRFFLFFADSGISFLTVGCQMRYDLELEEHQCQTEDLSLPGHSHLSLVSGRNSCCALACSSSKCSSF